MLAAERLPGGAPEAGEEAVGAPETRSDGPFCALKAFLLEGDARSDIAAIGAVERAHGLLNCCRICLWQDDL